jgi:hypothetical protein
MALAPKRSDIRNWLLVEAAAFAVIGEQWASIALAKYGAPVPIGARPPSVL